MKAISIHQPWAWLIANGHKDIENRSWPTKFRGRVLIHASKGMSREDYEIAQATLEHANLPDVALPPFDELERGGIVGVATIDSCIPGYERTSPWHMGSQFGFHITGAIPIPFVPCKGRLGFFEIDENVATKLERLQREGKE